MRSLPFVAFLAVSTVFTLGCPGDPEEVVPPTPDPCEIDLAALGVTQAVGTGARAKVIESAAEFIGGQSAQAELGDVLLENDRIRVVIQRPVRYMGPQPYGGNIIDADIRRPAGEPGRDQFGEIGLLYSFGRTLAARSVSVVQNGEAGGAAVIRVDGDDTVNDFINVANQIDRLLPGGPSFVISSEAPVPAKITTFYVLNPGENRVRVLTSFCNQTDNLVSAPVGDLIDRGGSLDLLNPGGCANGMGAGSCLAEASSWFGYQGEVVAYGLRPYDTSDLSKPSLENAVLTVSGVSGTLVGGKDQQGLLKWLDPDAPNRPGTFTIRERAVKNYLRDFVVGRDLAEVSSTWLALDSAGRARIASTVTLADGTTPAPGARVAVQDQAGKMVTLAVADSAGAVKIDLPAGTYSLSASLQGHGMGGPFSVTVPPSGSISPALPLGPSAPLTITVRDPFGNPSPGKVTVVCPTGTCPRSANSYQRFTEAEGLPTNVATIAFVPPQGSLTLPLPPGAYQVLVSRGPEWTVWPDTWPVSGAPVDLTDGGVSVAATVAHVIETDGWMSADLHVHSVNSPDSQVRNEIRAADFAAEGVDILCSTEHDHITDMGPYIRAIGAESLVASLIGAEITPFDWGHYNGFPLVVNGSLNGGAFDWAGGEGPTLRPSQMIAGVKAAHPNAVVQMNHPRGTLGSLTQMKVDTATFASHAPAAEFRMDPAPGATDANTRLFSPSWDAIEIMTGVDEDRVYGVMNDWMTFMSAGLVRTATATSDTHSLYSTQGGYPRTYVRTAPIDTAPAFDPAQFAQRLRAHQAFGTNSPFLTVTAQKLSSDGGAIGPSLDLGATVSVNADAGESLAITVRVQALDWMSLEKLELYSHAAGRESTNGIENKNWPSSRILQTKTIPSLAAISVPINAQSFRKLDHTETFTVQPTADTWYVVLLRNSSSARNLFPLTYDGISCSSGTCTARHTVPFAYTNPFLVDADGTDAYDNFPGGAGDFTLPPPPGPETPRTYSEAEILEALLSLKNAH